MALKLDVQRDNSESNNDKTYVNMLIRRKCRKRVTLVVVVFIASFYVSTLLFGDFKTPKVIGLTDLHQCPVCYGISVCPELYSNQIILDYTWTGLLNAKNVYYGVTKSNRRVVLKKLAHNWEFKEFDSKLCKEFNLKDNCKPIQLLNKNIPDSKLLDLVRYNLSRPDTEPRKGLVMCPYAYSLHDLIAPVLNRKTPQPGSLIDPEQQKTQAKVDLINIWTMLSINPEPLILQILKKSAGWPVPAYGGVCGRLEVVAHEGESLSTMTHVDWYKKLKYAKRILDAAMDFTYKHDRFRFYLMDWSLDNIAVNEKDEITFVDLEDMVVLDKHISPGKDLPHWYSSQRNARESLGPGFSFSIEEMCKHHLSDHNLWAACYILAGDENPFLYPIPEKVNSSKPLFGKVLNTCLNGHDRFKAITKLQHIIDDIMTEQKDGAR